MPRVLCVLLWALSAVWLPGRAAADGLLFEPFDAAPLAAAETRLMHAALAALDDYAGELDAAWDAGSDRAFAAYARRAFGEAPRNLHAAALIVDFLAAIDALGWTHRHLADPGISLALPERVLAPPVPEDGGARWWSPEGTLTLLTHRSAAPEARAWHAAARAANADAAALRSIDGDRVLITEGLLDDGRRFFTRSDAVDGGWATAFLASGPDQAALMTLMRASLRPGAPVPWELPEGGRLDRLVGEALALVEALDAPAAALSPEALRLTDARAASATGTGFFVSDRVLITAQHVVGECSAIGLADGTGLTVIAEDAALDVAALAAPAPAAAWLPLLPAAGARLGQRVHAMGFPYYNITGTSMHLTGGNVSALVGVNDDGRFLSFTAPVQPGSSGGPLIGAQGDVLGVVVSRLSESFIAETTGTLPQNVNYALDNTELLAFLARHGIAPAGPGGAGFDLDRDGVPRRVEQAVVPVLCL